MPKIEITLKNDGTIQAEGVDFEGEGCVEATKFLDELFGEAEKVTLKSSFYMKTKQKDGLFGGFCG